MQTLTARCPVSARVICIEDTSVSDLRAHVQDKYTDLEIANYISSKGQTLISCVPDVGSDYFCLSNNSDPFTTVYENGPMVTCYAPAPTWHKSVISEDPSDLEICQLPNRSAKIQCTVSLLNKCVILNNNIINVWMGINYTFMCFINEITHVGLLYACQSLNYYYCVVIINLVMCKFFFALLFLL